jgi:hypothetical protein
MIKNESGLIKQLKQRFAKKTFYLRRHYNERAKTQLGIALGFHACQKGYSTLFTTVNSLLVLIFSNEFVKLN